MPMTATFTPSATAPSATVLPHTSAISSCGSATISAGAAAPAVADARTVRACDGGGKQARDPRRHPIGPRGVGGATRRARREGKAGGVLHHDPHVAHEPQLRAEVGEKFFRRHL